MRLQWIQDQWNEPSRADHYAMQIVQALCTNKENKPTLDKFKIPFKFVARGQSRQPQFKTAQEYSEYAQAMLAARFGFEPPPKRN